MKYLIIIAISALTFFSTQAFSQRSLADSVFTAKLTESQFKSGEVFLTMNLTDASSFFGDISMTKTSRPDSIVTTVKNFMKSLTIEGNYFNYTELVNSPFFESPLVTSFIFNTKEDSYFVRLWTDPKNTSKLSGITIAKYAEKMNPIF